MGRSLRADCYIYIYQLDKYLILPSYPETLSDSLGSTFQTTNILARTAPIQSYSYSGPRKLQVSLDLHRDMLNEVNFDNTAFAEWNKSKIVGVSYKKRRIMPNVGFYVISPVKEINSPDYIDTLIRYLQAMAMPSYKELPNAGVAINPPLVAVQFGSTVFIKGVVSGDIGVTYSGPITKDGKYQMVQLSFTVQEIEPTDADQIAKTGSWRGLAGTISKGLSLS